MFSFSLGSLALFGVGLALWWFLRSATLINFDGFLFAVVQNYTVWFGGKLGGGKTLCAFALAAELQKRGYAQYIVSNVPSVWNDRPRMVYENARLNGKGQPQWLDAVLVLDEAGLFMRSKDEALEFGSSLRKMGCYQILSSKEAPSYNMRHLSVERAFNFNAIGIPLWIYRASSASGHASHNYQRENYWFGIWRPSKYFGIYNTTTMPTEANTIKKLVQAHLERVRQIDDDEDITYFNEQLAQSTHPTHPASPEQFEGMAEVWGAFDQLQELQEQIQGTVIPALRRRNKKH